MIGLLQRVTRASVDIDGACVAEIGHGLLVLVGVQRNDSEREADRLLERLLGYRVFPDETGKMNRDVRTSAGGLLLVPQCGFFFRCGCGPPWVGATHCNVRRADEPHCPWCEWASLGSVGGGLALAVPPLLVGVLRRRDVSATTAFLAGIVAIPLAAGTGAAVTWLATDYPHLVVDQARDRAGVPSGPLHCGPK